MDNNHFPDDMTFWAERPSLPYRYKPQKKKKKLFRKEVGYTMNYGMKTKIKRFVKYYIFGILVYKKIESI
jgi:hypothetical protein